MGLGYTGMQAFALLSRFSPALDRVLTIGRQHHYSSYPDMMELSDQFGLGLVGERVRAALANSPYADELLKAFGCAEVQSLDVSGYEGASVIADLNEPIAPELVEQYSLVLESGTFEHVFNQRTAFENVFRMIKVGGQLVFITPCNGFCGHGFYQLSPELLFSLCAANDFNVEMAYVMTGVKADKIFLCPTPASIRARVEISWSGPISFVLFARKTRSIERINQPFQWDYQHLFWKGQTPSSGTQLFDDIFAHWKDGAAAPQARPGIEARPKPERSPLEHARMLISKGLHKIARLIEKKEPSPTATITSPSDWFYSVQPFQPVVAHEIRINERREDSER